MGKNGVKVLEIGILLGYKNALPTAFVFELESGIRGGVGGVGADRSAKIYSLLKYQFF